MTAVFDDHWSQRGKAPLAVRSLVRLPWGVKRWIWSHPTAWRAFSGVCRRLGWNPDAFGVYSANNGPFRGVAVRAIHVNHLWALMGGYEPDVSAWTVRAFANPAWLGDRRDVYDVGSYFGLMALLFARHADRVAAFEPSPANRNALEKNLALNPTLSCKIHVFPVAVGDRAGSVEMTFDGVQSTNQIKTDGVKLWSNAEDLPTTSTEMRPLDALLEESPSGGPWRPGFIKIDVEGAEGLVLAGARETLRRHRPSLLVETHNDEACAAVFDAFGAADYTVVRFEGGALRPATGAWPGGYGHVAAIPRERGAAPGVFDP
jgi:FkbM family methyltransferase